MPDSLLMVVLKATPFPVHQAIAYALRRALEKLEQHSAASAILRRPFSQTTPADVNELFGYVEDVIAESADIYHQQASRHARTLFINFSGALSSGQTIKRCGFKSRFKTRRPQMGSGRPLKAPNPETRLELVPTKFDSLQERNEKALEFGHTVRNQIVDLCEKTFKSHDEVLQTIRTARESGLPKLAPQSLRGISIGKTPHPKTLRALQPPQLLQVAAALVAHKPWALENRDYYFPFARLTQFSQYCLQTNAYTVVEILLSEYALPRNVVTACAIALMAFTALNADVLKRITLANVLIRGKHILIVGLKGRGGQLMSTEVSDTAANEDGDQLRIDHPVAVRAIGLLIDNTKRVEEITGEVGIPLLNMMKRKLRFYKWEPLDLYISAQEFWDFHKMNRVPSADLRRLCAHITLLTPGETIFSVQVLLGHANIKTTVEYVNSEIVAQLLDANIKRFGDKLAATALFMTGRGKVLKELGLGENDVQPLLFPVSKFSNEQCAVDRWIDSNGDSKIPMGLAEVRQCAVQYRYYQETFIALMNENPRRFASVHLPRIFFCAAMRQVLLASPHAAIYTRFELGAV